MTRRVQVLIACASLVLVVLLTDLLANGLVITPVLYVAPVLAALWSPKRSDVILVAGICMVLTAVGAYQYIGEAAVFQVFSNRLVAGVVIAATTLIGLHRKSLEEELASTNVSLQQRVGKTTAERDRAESALRDPFLTAWAWIISSQKTLLLVLFSTNRQAR